MLSLSRRRRRLTLALFALAAYAGRELFTELLLALVKDMGVVGQDVGQGRTLENAGGAAESTSGWAKDCRRSHALLNEAAGEHLGGGRTCARRNAFLVDATRQYRLR